MSYASIMVIGLILVLFTMVIQSITAKNVWVRGLVTGFFIACFTMVFHFFTVDTINYAVEFYAEVMK